MAKANEKFIEEIAQMSVMELAQLVKALEEKFGVSAAMPMAAMPAATEQVAVQAEEKSEYKVTLIEGGPEKIKSIKALRSVLPTLGMSEAKKAVEEAPTVIAESAPKADAQKMKEALEAVGAKVELS